MTFISKSFNDKFIIEGLQQLNLVDSYRQKLFETVFLAHMIISPKRVDLTSGEVTRAHGAEYFEVVLGITQHLDLSIVLLDMALEPSK